MLYLSADYDSRNLTRFVNCFRICSDKSNSTVALCAAGGGGGFLAAMMSVAGPSVSYLLLKLFHLPPSHCICSREHT